MTNMGGTDFSHEWLQVNRMLRRRMWTIIVFLVVTVAVVAVGTWKQLPIYEATSTVLIDMEAPSVLAVSHDSNDPTIGLTNYLTYADYYRTQLEIIDSRALLNRVARNVQLKKEGMYNQPPTLLDKARSLANRLTGTVRVRSANADPMDDLVDQFQGNVTVEPIKQTRLAQIHVDDSSPKQAARLANEIAFVYAQQNLEKTAAAETLMLMKNQYLALEAKEAELSKRYKAKHPAMVRLHQEMGDLAQAIQLEADRQTQQARAEAEGILKPSPAAPQAGNQAPTGRVASALRPNNIRVEELAQLPEFPVKPRKILSLLLGLVLGLIGGLGIAVLQEMLDSSIKSPDELERDEDMTLLGYVPRMERLPLKLGDHAIDRYHHVEQDPYSQIAEAYRALRTSLLYKAAPTDTSPIVFTSPGMGEGKTTTICNLGITLAQTGLNVLLVDADLRKGRLHEAFQLKKSPGLSEVLLGRATVDQAIQETSVPGLSVMASGAFPSNPAELLSSPRMQQLLDALGKRFARVLIDSPPVIAVTDAAILAAMTQNVIGIAQSGRTPRQALRRLAATCREVHAKLLGVVLNNVPRRDAPAYIRYAPYRYEADKSADSNGAVGRQPRTRTPRTGKRA